MRAFRTAGDPPGFHESADVSPSPVLSWQTIVPRRTIGNNRSFIGRQALGPVLSRSRLGISAQSRSGLQIGAGGRIAPEQGEDVAAEDIEVVFLRCQTNRLRELLEYGLGRGRFRETHLATVLPGLPQTRTQP